MEETKAKDPASEVLLQTNTQASYLAHKGEIALHLALRAGGIGPGDAVITVSHTAVATVAAVELARRCSYSGRRRSRHVHDGSESTGGHD